MKSKETKKVSRPQGKGDSPDGYYNPKPWLKTGTKREAAPKVVIKTGKK
jgi:hypothetical protein